MLLQFLTPSDSVRFRLLPISPVIFHFVAHLVSVYDVNISGRQDDDGGRAYLGTHQALSDIWGGG